MVAEMKEASPDNRQVSLSQIKMNRRNRKAKRPGECTFDDLDFDAIAHRLQEFLNGIYGVGVTSVGAGNLKLFVYQAQENAETSPDVAS